MSDATVVVNWLFPVIMALAPPDRQSFVPEAQETVEQGTKRREEIVNSIVEVVYNPNFEPLFSGSYGRARSAMLILTLMYYESGFRRDVDLGIGRPRLSRQGWNDYGNSWCMMQVNLGQKKVEFKSGHWVTDSAQNTVQGWSGLELLADRRKCIIAGADIIRKSIDTCRTLPFDERLSVYASGSCEKGRSASISRMIKFRRLFSRFVPPARDLDISYNGFVSGYSDSLDVSWFQ